MSFTTFPIPTILSPIFNAQSYGWLPDGTDHSTQALALLAAVSAAGGGTIIFPVGIYRADSQLLIPNDAASPPTQVNIAFEGVGGGESWGTGKTASQLDLRFQSADDNAKIESRGKGALRIENLSFTDGGTANVTPFVHVTNTTLLARNCIFQGSTSNTGQRGIVLGGTSATVNGLVTGAFQGYGTVINNNLFTSLGIGVHLQTAANSVVITYNAFNNPKDTTWIKTSPLGAISGIYVTGNLLEVNSPIVHGMILQDCQTGVFGGNNFNDPTNGVFLSSYHLVANTSFSTGNTFIRSFDAVVASGSFITQSGSALQLARSTILGADTNAPDRLDSSGNGFAISELAGNVIVKGKYDSSKIYPGQLTVTDEDDSGQALALSVDASNNKTIINSGDASHARPLVINPISNAPTIFNGSISSRTTTSILSNGLQSNINLWAADNNIKSSFVRITGPTGAFSLGGFTTLSSGVGAEDGRILTVFNTTSQQMTIVNSDGSSTAGNKIQTLTGGNVVLRAGTSAATFIYDTADTVWVLISTN